MPMLHCTGLCTLTQWDLILFKVVFDFLYASPTSKTDKKDDCANCCGLLRKAELCLLTGQTLPAHWPFWLNCPGQLAGNSERVFFFLTFIFNQLFLTIVSRNALSLGYSEQDTSSVSLNTVFSHIVSTETIFSFLSWKSKGPQYIRKAKGNST